MSADDRQAIIDGLVSTLEQKGLTIMPAAVLEDYQRLKQAQDLLTKRSKLTPYEIAKFQLIPNATTPNTVKNMVKDGRIRKAEAFRDRNNKLYITTTAVKRLRSELC